MGLYIKTKDGYEIEQYDSSSKIKIKYNNEEIADWELYLRKEVSIDDFVDLSTNKIINQNLIEKFKKLFIEEIILPDNIEIINKRAFMNCEDLKIITLPKELKTIEKYAFSDCNSLKKIELPEGVQEIKDCTFYNCENLKEIKLAEGLKAIGYSAFYNDESLETIKIPSSIEYINVNAFQFCYDLKEIMFEDESYKDKEDLQNFIKEYEHIIKTKSLDDIIKNNTKNSKKELSKQDELER